MVYRNFIIKIIVSEKNLENTIVITCIAPSYIIKKQCMRDSFERIHRRASYQYR